MVGILLLGFIFLIYNSLKPENIHSDKYRDGATLASREAMESHDEWGNTWELNCNGIDTVVGVKEDVICTNTGIFTFDKKWFDETHGVVTKGKMFKHNGEWWMCINRSDNIDNSSLVDIEATTISENETFAVSKKWFFKNFGDFKKNKIFKYGVYGYPEDNSFTYAATWKITNFEFGTDAESVKVEAVLDTTGEHNNE